ncbi:MAG: urate oxidase [Acidobacteriota bacterium]|nr:urate oxidase [Acidobacteriota bacterium]
MPLSQTSYGKSRIRLVQVSRRGDRHELRDLTVAVRFEGEYDTSYTEGDNSNVLPTDTMKNTVYALAARERVREPESFGVVLGRHFLDRNPRLRTVHVEVVEHGWGHIPIGDREHGQSFVRRGPESRTARVMTDAQDTAITSGVADLVILKSSRSAFAGFPRDEFTTLPETQDRLLATSLTSYWTYRSEEVDFGPSWRAVRAALLEAFANHDSLSVQHTLHAMGQAVLETVDAVQSITLVMPNRHHLPVDLSKFGLENRNEIFVATEEPHGLIEATLSR